MPGITKQYPYRRITLAALHKLVPQFIRLTAEAERKTLETYVMSDGRMSVSSESLEVVSLDWDRFTDHQVMITGGDDSIFSLASHGDLCRVEVAGSRELISALLPLMDSAFSTSESWTADPVIFIAHGRRDDWKLLRDHLRDKQKFRVEFFESESRVGKSIRPILDIISSKTGCAVIVYTGEDKLEDGTLRPRPNVIHECGFFSAGLKEGRTLVLLERNVEVPTNQAGEQYIEFEAGRIEAAFGEVVAAIRALIPRA